MRAQPEASRLVDGGHGTAAGFSAGMFPAGLACVRRVADRPDAGSLWINGCHPCPVDIPFGGPKQSGFGRENSLAALEYYTELETVYVAMGPVQSPY